MKSFVRDAMASTEDAIGNLVQLIGRLDYELDVLVNTKSVQADPKRLAKIAEYRVACRDFMHNMDQFTTTTDKFKESINSK